MRWILGVLTKGKLEIVKHFFPLWGMHVIVQSSEILCTLNQRRYQPSVWVTESVESQLRDSGVVWTLVRSSRPASWSTAMTILSICSLQKIHSETLSLVDDRSRAHHNYERATSIAAIKVNWSDFLAVCMENDSLKKRDHKLAIVIQN